MHKYAGLCMILFFIISVHAERTFFWSMESDIPDIVPYGTDSTMRGSAQIDKSNAFKGNSSLNCSGTTYRLAMFDNPESKHIWTGLNEGTVRLFFKYSKITGFMLFQITGKDITLKDDTNDAIICSYKKNSSQWLLTYFYNGAADSKAIKLGDNTKAGVWNEMVVRWRSENDTYFFQLSINGNTAETSVKGTPNCKAWHHLLIGNDTESVPDGLWIDNFEVYNSWTETFNLSSVKQIQQKNRISQNQPDCKKISVLHGSNTQITDAKNAVGSHVIFDGLGRKVFSSQKNDPNTIFAKKFNVSGIYILSRTK